MRHTWMLGLVLALAPSVAAAQTVWSYTPVFPLPPGTETRTQTVALGPGLSVEKAFACRGRMSGYNLPQCTPLGWRPRGFVFGARPDLERAYTFSGDGRGRIIASTERDVIWTEDQGRTWTRADWNGVVRPQVIAIDPYTRFGVALAEGAIHATDDAGVSWHFVREIPACRLVRAVVVGRNAVLADAGTGVWALAGGGELQVVSEPGNGLPWFTSIPEFRVDGEAIVVTDAAGHSARIAASGSIERTALAGNTLWGH